MANLRTISRVTSCALRTARLGTVVTGTRTSPIQSPVSEFKSDGICVGFRELGITPQEAKMSAAALFSHTKMVSSSFNTQIEYRLPTLVTPVLITVPSLHNGTIIKQDLPSSLINIFDKVDPLEIDKKIQEPQPNQVIEKQAARLIVIRKRKMRVHKLKKLRKKMKFVFAKVKLKRKMRKEALFMSEQVSRVREAQSFSAEAYVTSFLKRVKEKPIPNFWKGKRLPKPIVEQLMEEDKRRKEAIIREQKEIAERKILIKRLMAEKGRKEKSK